jgi:hypothetical protein
MAEPDEVIRGGVVPPEIKAEFDSLRTVFDTKTALDRVDSYGKWLFGSAAIVGSLGAGLSSSSFAKLRGLGVWSFALAVVALGVCLVAASQSLAPQWVEVRLTDLKSLRHAVNSQFGKRQRLLTVAAFFFALALTLAALSPLASIVSTSDRVPTIHYTLDDKGVLDSGVEAGDLRAGLIVRLRLEADGKAQVPSSMATVDESGQVKLSLKTPITTISKGKIDLVVCEQMLGETNCAKIYRMTVKTD